MTELKLPSLFGKALLNGTISKKQLSILFFPVLFLQMACWAIARMLYPHDDGYYMNFLHISRQGNILMNPIGGWFFVISTAITGFFLVFYFIFLYRRLLPSFKYLARLFLFTGTVGGIGLAFVGMFPEGPNSTIQFLHNVGSTCAFTGLGCTAGFSLLIMLVRIIQKRPWPSIPQFLGVFALTFHFVLMFPFTLGSVNQWTGFYIIFVWVVGMFLIAPELPDVVSD